MITGLSFASPLLLTGLLALPVLWLVLRAVPPAAVRRRFPGVALLIGLEDKQRQADRTPLWLLILRCLIAASLIFAAAEPRWLPQGVERSSDASLLVIIDNSWAAAPDWELRTERAASEITQAGREGRQVALIATGTPEAEIVFGPWSDALARLEVLEPVPWLGSAEESRSWIATLARRVDALWISDGLDGDWREGVLKGLRAVADVRVLEKPSPVYLLDDLTVEDGLLSIAAKRRPVGDALTRNVNVVGLDPAGVERTLLQVALEFIEGADRATVQIDLPPEIRNRLVRIEFAGVRSAGSVWLVDDSLRRPKVALVSDNVPREGAELLSPLHYLREALNPNAALFERPLSEIIPAGMDTIILADVAEIPGQAATDLERWVREGGTLIRFAGPRLAASELARRSEDNLLPVRLRSGGRSVGGAMSWGAPKSLAPFDGSGPFAGLVVPNDVSVTAQVVAQPDPELSQRVLAALDDGTPLVTRKTLGSGQVVLFHVTANAEWSSLPLSGLFVQMLERLVTGVSIDRVNMAPESLWQLVEEMDGYGRLAGVDTRQPVKGNELLEGAIGPDLRPGLYEGEVGRRAINVAVEGHNLNRIDWPDWIAMSGFERVSSMNLMPPLFMVAVGLLITDILATLVLTGRLSGRGHRVAGLIAFLFVWSPSGEGVWAQEIDPAGIRAAGEVTLAHVLTGDSDVDQTAREGLQGLSEILTRRTAVEPALPVGVDVELDELAFYPLLYWPISGNQPVPSRSAYEKLNRYLKAGGLILFDTRDAGFAGFGTGSVEASKLRAITIGLDIPPLEPVPEDHVLSRAFYLLQSYPGRHNGEVWVEVLRGSQGGEGDGLALRDPNDGVTPVIIGGNDWARAWALDAAGFPLYPVGRGQAGARQRELAYRFGVNVVMHVLTGNYKADQVHVPALLDRLGQ